MNTMKVVLINGPTDGANILSKNQSIDLVIAVCDNGCYISLLKETEKCLDASLLEIFGAISVLGKNGNVLVYGFSGKVPDISEKLKTHKSDSFVFEIVDLE